VVDVIAGDNLNWVKVDDGRAFACRRDLDQCHASQDLAATLMERPAQVCAAELT
jgi:hypothetical protein